MSVHAPAEWVANLRLDPSAWIAPGAVVTGDVALGARASVWFNTVIRGDTAAVSVGEESNVQDNSTVHVDADFPAVIGPRVTIGHRAVVHGCVIEADCLIGMGAVILSGARIGRGSLVAAAALVREGQEVPPGSLVVGAPARVAGPVSESHREAIARGTQHYVELSRSYLRRGFALPHPAARAAAGTTARDRGPMTFLEWTQLLAVLAESPDWVGHQLEGLPPERVRGPAAAERWSALEVVCHLRDADREVLAPRLARFLAESEPWFDNVDMTGWDRARHYREQGLEGALGSWREARRGAVEVLATLGRPDWSRLAFHSLHGPYPLAEMVRSWAEHDLSHRRQLAEALRAGA